MLSLSWWGASYSRNLIIQYGYEIVLEMLVPHLIRNESGTSFCKWDCSWSAAICHLQSVPEDHQQQSDHMKSQSVESARGFQVTQLIEMWKANNIFPNPVLPFCSFWWRFGHSPSLVRKQHTRFTRLQSGLISDSSIFVYWCLFKCLPASPGMIMLFWANQLLLESVLEFGRHVFKFVLLD